MSLLEVLIALAIFLASMAIIGQLVATGSQAAIGAQLKAEAARRCDTVMAEALAGAVPLQTAAAVPFSDDPSWTWSLTVVDGPLADLLQVEVRVARQTGRGQPQTEFVLTRWTRDPGLWTQATVSGSSAGGGSL